MDVVESFRSTLDELGYADLVLLMVDASESADTARTKLGSCLDVLNQLDVDPKRVLLVLNKIDLLKDVSRERIEEDSRFKDFASIRVSAVRGDGLHRLRSRIVELTRLAKARSSAVPA